MALAEPGVDALLSIAIGSETLAEVTVCAQALRPCVARRESSVDPRNGSRMWHTVAYWDQYGFPDVLPAFGFGTLDFWCLTPRARQACRRKGRSESDDQLYRPTAAF